jgi:hypothetical protein
MVITKDIFVEGATVGCDLYLNILADNTISSTEKSQVICHVAKNLTKDILQNIGITGGKF